MFACAITANVCYGLGILIRAYSWEVIYSSAPWILGSLGTVSLDIVIFTQVSHAGYLLTLSHSVTSAACVCLASHRFPPVPAIGDIAATMHHTFCVHPARVHQLSVARVLLMAVYSTTC